MDISALMNHEEPAVLPRRSLSSSVPISSPIISTTKTPTTPRTTNRQMPRRSRRHEPKPIWAYREGEELPAELKRQQEERLKEQRAKVKEEPQPEEPQRAVSIPRQPETPPVHQGNGARVRPTVTSELLGLERPVSDDAMVYDEVSRRVADFIWDHAVMNPLVQNAIADPLTQLEIEARWGQIIETRTNSRMRGYHGSECVIKTETLDVKFESTMTLEQHKRMNVFLNSQVQKAKAPGASRASVDYSHPQEVDIFYELDQPSFKTLNPAVQQLIAQSGKSQRIRVTKDPKTGQVIRSMIKQRIANLEISSPLTEWDYRIGLNVEIAWPGPVDNLKPVVEPSRPMESNQRHKDRMSYSWLAYQIDLTQVTQGQSKNHELELELNANVLMQNAEKVQRGEENEYEKLINGMMNNLRVLSREITPQPRR